MSMEPEEREYIFQLHRSGRPWDKRGDEVNWDAIAVGVPVPFKAVQFGISAWCATGPVVAKAPEALADAGWTVSAGLGEVPIMVLISSQVLGLDNAHRPRSET